MNDVSDKLEAAILYILYVSFNLAKKLKEDIDTCFMAG